MLLSIDSPLRLLPTNINPQQAMILNGIRIAMDIVDVSYLRLIQDLLTLSKDEQCWQKNILAIPSVLSDAWTIIDSTHQIRTLLEYIIKITAKNPYDRAKAEIIDNPYEVVGDLSTSDFIRNTENVTELRNIHSHLKGTWQRLLSSKKPVWGTLYWVDTTSLKNNNGNESYDMYGVSGGTLLNIQEQIKAAKGPKLDYPIGWVTLTGPDCQVNISSLYEFLDLLAKQLEKQIGLTFDGHPRMPCIGTFKLSFSTTHPCE